MSIISLTKIAVSVRSNLDQSENSCHGKGRERAFPALLRIGMAGASGVVNPPNRKESMQTPTEQPQSPNPEAPPAKRLRREWIFVVAEGAFCAALALAGAFLLRGPDGPFDPAAFHERMGAGPSWGRGVLLAALLMLIF